MNDIDRDQIAEALAVLDAHRGSDNSITAAEFGQEIGLDEGASFEAKELLQYLLYEKGIPIAATRNGYFLIDSKQELHSYIQQLNRSQYRTEKRERAAKRAFDGGFDIDTVAPAELVPD